MANELVRVSLHAEMQKFGRKLDPRKPNIGTGLELTYAENRALFAVQKLLSQTDYVGNTASLQVEKYDLPGLKIKATKYLEAYGVKKYETKRGKMEFSGTERNYAMKALESLSTRNFRMGYKRMHWDKTKKCNVSEQIKRTAPLIALQKENKGEYLIYPSPLLIDQIDTYFVWLPADLYEKVPDRDQTAVLFIEYLISMKRRAKGNGEKSPIRLDPETMARTLRLNTMIDARQWNRVRAKLDELYRLAKDLGYLDGYQIELPGVKVEKVDVLRLAKSLPHRVARSTNTGSKVYQVA